MIFGLNVTILESKKLKKKTLILLTSSYTVSFERSIVNLIDFKPASQTSEYVSAQSSDKDDKGAKQSFYETTT